MINLELSAEFRVDPVFRSDPDEMGPVELSELRIPDSLAHRIRDWDDRFQSSFNPEYPPDSGFKSLDERESHNRDGKRLAEELQSALGNGYSVTFVPLAPMRVDLKQEA